MFHLIDKQPKFFKTVIGSTFQLEELTKFTQGDLGDRDCIILDSFYEIYVCVQQVRLTLILVI